MGIRVLAILLHIMSSGLALVVSESQTQRILKVVRSYNMALIIPFVVGAIVAPIGTIVILKKVNKGIQKIQENNQMLKGGLK
jgi:uncharacterized membrane protein YdcZ (DUF606 family)